MKDVTFSTQISKLAEMKARIVQHIRRVTLETIRSVVQHIVSRHQLLAENGGQRIEYALHQSFKI